jgi:PE family
MSFVVAAPETLAAASADVGSIGSAVNTAHAAAASATTSVGVAAGDEVSSAIAALFSGHAQEYHALSAQAAAWHAEFVQALTGAGGAYAAAEAANASPLQTLEQDILGAINAPTSLLLGRPLIGNGANGVEPLHRAPPVCLRDPDTHDMEPPRRVELLTYSLRVNRSTD